MASDHMPVTFVQGLSLDQMIYADMSEIYILGEGLKEKDFD